MMAASWARLGSALTQNTKSCFNVAFPGKPTRSCRSLAPPILGPSRALSLTQRGRSGVGLCQLPTDRRGKPTLEDEDEDEMSKPYRHAVPQCNDTVSQVLDPEGWNLRCLTASWAW
jgi:hypothetical protein